MVNSVSSGSGYSGYDSVSALQRHKELFAKLDTNSDDKIDQLELSAAVSASGKGKDVLELMTQVDTNSDGSIDAAENETFLSQMDSQKQARSTSGSGASGNKPPGPPPVGPPPSGGGGGMVSQTDDDETEVFDKLDTNKDGVVSLQELLAAAAEDESDTDKQDAVKVLFNKIDSNGDGSIDRTESDSFLQQLEAERQARSQEAATYNNRGRANYDGMGGTINVTL